MNPQWKIRICKYLTLALLVTGLAVVQKAAAAEGEFAACMLVVQENCLERYPEGP